jgi:uncharacterized repeat protein (TIGR01451 family)
VRQTSIIPVALALGAVLALPWQRASAQWVASPSNDLLAQNTQDAAPPDDSRQPAWTAVPDKTSAPAQGQPAGKAPEPAPDEGPKTNSKAPARPLAFRRIVPKETPVAGPEGPPPTPGAPEAQPVAAATLLQTPAITLERHGPASAAPGKPFCYEMVVRNIGPVPAIMLRIDDELTPGTRLLKAEPPPRIPGDHMTWVVERLDPNREYRIQMEVQPAGVEEFVSKATVTVGVAASQRTRLQGPQLAVTMTGPALVAVGEAAVFQIRVTNLGTAPVGGLVLRDHLPPGLKHEMGSEIEADLSPIEPGATRTIDLKTEAVQAGTYVNEAIIVCGDGQQVSAQTAFTISATPPAPASPPSVRAPEGPRLLTEVAAQAHALGVGKETTCEVRVLNAGAVPVTNLRVQAVAPAGVTPQFGEGPAAARVDGQHVVFEPQGALAPHTQTVYRLHLLGDRPTAGEGRVRVQVSCDQLATAQVREESLWVYRD